MITYTIECTVAPFTAFGPRACELMRFFGMNLDALRRRTLCHHLAVTLRDGQICLLIGPSGAGKSVLLNALYDHTPPDSRIRVESIPLQSDIAFIDAVDAPLNEALPILTRAGLADLPALLCPSAFLSDGQRWRARLACALLSKKQYIFADECFAVLDHTTACAVAWNLRRTANRTGRTFILAGCREDILTDLSPDVLIHVAADRVDIRHAAE